MSIIINKYEINLYSVGLIKFECISIQLLLNVYFVLSARRCVEISRNSSKKTNLFVWLRWSTGHPLCIVCQSSICANLSSQLLIQENSITR